MTATTNQTDVEQWGVFELALTGSADGNPYLDLELTGQCAADVVDPWEMTITRFEQPVIRATAVPLPGKPYQALILRRAG